MPNIFFENQEISCETGENLRKVLMKNSAALYNGNAKIINCRGIGSCGTCAVEISGEVAPKNWQEKTRLSLPPHKADSHRRLACQVQVKGDLHIKKYNGFWGEGDRPTA